MDVSMNPAAIGDSATPSRPVDRQGRDALAAADARAARQRRNATLIAVAFLALLACVPWWSGGAFGLGRYGVAIAYVIAAIGLNLAFGYAGEMVLGHPAIMAAAAYGAGMASALLGLEIWAAAPLGVLTGLALAMLMMIPGLRISGWYLALITMFVVIVMPHVVILGEAWTGGEFGLSGMKAARLLDVPLGQVAIYELSVLMLAITLLVSANLLRSTWGLRLRALRDAKQAAQSVGIDLARTRLATYLICAVPPAVAGVALAYTERFVNADSFGINLTLMLLTGVVLGGAGTMWGPVVGMVPLVALSFWVGPFSPYNAVLLGLGLLAGTLVFPDGIVPAISRRRARSAAADDVAEAAVRVETPAQARSTASAIDRRDASAAPASASNSASNSASDEPVVRMRGVRKRFGGQVALDGIDLDIRRGAFIGLVGPNGSGKSTLLNALCGIVTPDEGVIHVLGRDVTHEPVHRIAAAGVGRTFQVPQLIEDLSALENIEIGLVAAAREGLVSAALRLPRVRASARERRRIAYDMLRDVGLPASSIELPASELPLGLKRIVEVGRAAVAAPSILLLDEPAAGLNDAERAQLGGLLESLSRRGMTVMVVEHNVPFVMAHCHELVLLETGRIVCHAHLREGPPPQRLIDYLNYSPIGAQAAEVAS